MFLSREFPTAEALRRQSFGENKPTAFLPHTIERSNSYLRPAVYFVKSFWTTTEGDNLALAFGSVVFSFDRFDGKHRDFYLNLSFDDLMVLGKRKRAASGLSFDVERRPFAIAHGSDKMWTYPSATPTDLEPWRQLLHTRLAALPDAPNDDIWRVMDRYSIH
jgi:hypothetical protein